MFNSTGTTTTGSGTPMTNGSLHRGTSLTFFPTSATELAHLSSFPSLLEEDLGGAGDAVLKDTLMHSPMQGKCYYYYTATKILYLGIRILACLLSLEQKYNYHCISESLIHHEQIIPLCWSIFLVLDTIPDDIDETFSTSYAAIAKHSLESCKSRISNGSYVEHISLRCECGKVLQLLYTIVKFHIPAASGSGSTVHSSSGSTGSAYMDGMLGSGSNRTVRGQSWRQHRRHNVTTKDGMYYKLLLQFRAVVNQVLDSLGASNGQNYENVLFNPQLGPPTSSRRHEKYCLKVQREVDSLCYLLEQRLTQVK